MPRDSIPGIPRESEQALLDIIGGLQKRLAVLETPTRVQETQAQTFLARAGQTFTLDPPAAGMTVLLERARSVNRGAEVKLVQLNGNRVLIECVDGLVNGQSQLLSNAAGTYVAISDGERGWALNQNITSGGVVGLPGTPGLPGAGGLQGFPGAPGRAGEGGRQGVPGQPGAAGSAGAAGATGAAGVPGAPGRAGADGSGKPFVHTPELATYVNGALVGRRQEIDLVQGANVTLTPTVVGGRPTVTVAASGGGGSGVVLSVSVNLGDVAKNGFFDITGLVGLTLNSPVLVQAGVQITDPTETEDQIVCSGVATSTTTVRVYWMAVEGFVGGTRTFHYVLPTTAIGSLTVQDDGVTVVSGVGIINFTSSNNIDMTVTTPGAGQANVSAFMDFSKRFSDTTATGAQIPYPLSAQASTVNLILFSTGTGDITVHSIDAWYRSRRVRFSVSRTNTSKVTFLNESASEATVTNRIQGIATADGEFNGQFTITAGESVVFVYDADSDRWRIESYSVHPSAAGGLIATSPAPGGNVTETRPFDERLFCYDVTGSVGATTTTIQALREGVFGDICYVGRQGAGTDQLILEDNAAGPTAEQLIAICQDEDVILFDDETATLVYTDLTLTAGTGERWACTSHIPPFCNTTSCVARDHIVHDGTRWQRRAGLGKTMRACEFWEDFEFLVRHGTDAGSGGQFQAASATGAADPVLNGVVQKTLMFGQTNWGGFGSGEVASVTIDHLSGEASHPGVIRFTTSSADNDFGCIFRGDAPDDGWIVGSDVRIAEACWRLTSSTSCALFFGYCEDLTDALDFTTVANSNIIGFIIDSDNASVDVNWHAITREADGAAVITDTGVPLVFGWDTFEIRQEVLGTVTFYINGNLVATHTSQIPDTESMNFGLHFRTRTTASRVLSLDYIGMESQPLDRTVN